MVKLSFIIPVYKTPLALLRNCLDSVIKYSEPMELICVLDSPGDPCEQVLDEYAAKEPRMRLLKNDRNRGVSYSRNRGLDAATGEWVAFVDADDEIVAETYEKAVSKVGGTKLSGCALSALQQPGSHWGVEWGGYVEGTVNDPLSAAKLVASYYMAVYPMVLRRDLFARYGIRFLEGHRFGEDFIVVTKILCTGERFAFWNIGGYKCVGYAGSTCRAKPSADNFTHGLIAGLEVMRQVTAAKVALSASRWYLSHIIPMLFFDGSITRFVKGAARKQYLAALSEFAALMVGEYAQVLRQPARMVFGIVKAHPKTWFMPGMPLAFVLRMLGHYGKMLRYDA